jgi:hypothetical protein|tara:strand:+ start:2321 stop:2962 length:642 start_codon:yes stop_codon:yes gene_type:complete
MTYSELKSLIQDYLQNTETSFVSNINNVIKQAEERILKTVKLPVFRKNVSGNLSSGSEYLATPTDFLDNFSLSITNSSEQSFLLFKDVNFIREAYPNASTTGIPKHYALFDDSTFIVGPTPNAAFTVELHYFYRPASITAGADSGTTWLSTNARNALLYASLIEGYMYMKGDMDLMNQYEKRYMESISRLKTLGEGDNTVDTYRDDVVRVQRT